MDSLFRFELFLSIEAELRSFDEVYFFNTNMQFLDTVGEEIIAPETGNRLVGVLHPADGIRHLPPCFFFYERNKKSAAYIAPWEKNYHYYMGVIIGGHVPQFLDMTRILASDIRKDYKLGIIAKFHDESHLNKYFQITPGKLRTI